ncbi:MAG: thioredoxin [Clostridia bacterium]|nr:thioredoxin [Clostridia bacterium]
MAGAIVEAGDADFDKVVSEADVPVLVDFWAAWCGPCRMLAPVVEDLAQEYGGRVKVVKVDVDNNPATAARFGVMSIPTLILFEKGEEKQRLIGFRPKAELAQVLEGALAR